VQQSTGDQTNLIDYENAGGRAYATHYSYVWLYDDAPFSGTADWAVNTGSQDAQETVNVNTSFSKGAELSDWLQLVGASTTVGEIPLSYLRNDFTGVIAPSENWLSWDRKQGAWPIHYTFNTPVGQDAGTQCGRAVFSDFHVENATSSQNTVFPGECTVGPMTPQEKVLEFMLFDLASCIVQNGSGPVCEPRNCFNQGFNCGQQGDGCGDIIDCGGCDGGGICGGNGQAGVCSPPPCLSLTCMDQNIGCGPAGDGCGNTLNCGGCDGGDSCGGGGTPGQCGSGGVCQPESCKSQGLSCGPAGDGCGNTINCGGCDAGQTCGGGGMAGGCGAPSCTPSTCQQYGYNCGETGDGCGGTINCGSCDGGVTCGSGGIPNVCGFVIQ
jgi:hypothetical protein